MSLQAMLRACKVNTVMCSKERHLHERLCRLIVMLLIRRVYMRLLKDYINSKFVEGLERMHGDLRRVAGYVAILDDEDLEGRPRTTRALVAAGLPRGRILAPNREEAVVAKLRLEGALSEKKEFRRALDEEFRHRTPVIGAYLDATTGNAAELQAMIDVVVARANRHPLAVAYTIVARDFTPGCAKPFVRRVLEMYEYLKGEGFVPMMNDAARSYFEPPRLEGKRAGTAFWVKEGSPRRRPEVEALLPAAAVLTRGEADSRAFL